MALLQFPLLLNFRSSPSPGISFTRGRDFKIRCSNERQALFNRIAPVYDNLNDLLSLGQHRVWKRMAVSWSGAKGGDTVLDICCGSGDLAFLLSEKVGVDGQVLGLDFSREQLLIASSRQQERSSACYKNIEWLQGDALNLPFPNDTFDAITMGYGLRNVTDKERAVQEIFRVLKPGCKVSILDFNKSNQPVTGLIQVVALDAVINDANRRKEISRNIFIIIIQEWMIDNVVVPAATVYGLADEYKYLKSSIQEFLTGKELEQLALAIGFSDAKFYEIAGGLMGNLVATC
ncbi:2-phytyl-1,4-beta-naphthoquinone methyltransferase, chloroplastic isoform X1 [Amaranthus tricolor]|uniref:2-phytyl-1,4-beta-naphthoquinone methyltransferase, chloroplastic isoform X1 n=2 Tax=Amaranthus tricolor TaxID=29722 RepID=UPI00258EC034|nr:2-phytyl-1,4-beta-naphthoquinone methyltransferase, chloroplastic isoform X1 [Amaranthus tricolor]